jgi:hypothetical protein
MNITTGDIWTLKLNSGEELVAKVTSVTDIDIVLHDPLSVAPGPQGVGLIPSLFTADPKGETRLNKSSIAIYAITDESVKTKYTQATSNLIVPETKKLILG